MSIDRQTERQADRQRKRDKKRNTHRQGRSGECKYRGKRWRMSERGTQRKIDFERESDRRERE
jgi:hypothetical protein